jgi:predicted metal-dependent hydrolase
VGLVRLEADGSEQTLSVPGAAAHLPRRVSDWLKREARRDLEAAVARYAAEIGRTAAAIRIGDARSRWGSWLLLRACLSFSWRPRARAPSVLSDLAAHESRISSR